MRWRRRLFRKPQRELEPFLARKIGNRTLVFPVALLPDDCRVRDTDTVVWK